MRRTMCLILLHETLHSVWCILLVIIMNLRAHYFSRKWLGSSLSLPISLFLSISLLFLSLRRIWRIVTSSDHTKSHELPIFQQCFSEDGFKFRFFRESSLLHTIFGNPNSGKGLLIHCKGDAPLWICLSVTHSRQSFRVVTRFCFGL